MKYIIIYRYSDDVFYVNISCECCESLDDVETIINGNNIEDCSFQELIRGVKFDEVSEEKISGEIEIKYTTHKATKQLVRVHTEITLWHEGEQYSKHTLSLVAKQEKEKPKRNFNTLVDE